jgi:hypothetical protein
MAFRFNPLTSTFDLVTSSDVDLTALQAQIDALEDNVNDLQTHSQTFTTATWTGPVLGQYSITVPFSSHNKTKPVVQIYELVAGQYQLVDCAVTVDGTNNVKISVNETPDLRFSGKIFIS